MANDKPKTDRKDEQAYDKSEINTNYDSDVGGAGGQAEGTADNSDLGDSYNSNDFNADDETS